MREGRASLTAKMVALLRLWGSTEPRLFGLSDTTPEVLLDGPLGLVAKLTSRAPMLARAARLLALGGVEHLALRTRAIDAAVTDGIEEGARQLVVLGAGFDGRAHRMSELRELDVFEVDHPDTQASKKRAAARLPLVAGTLRYVGVDFTNQSLFDRLEEEAHIAEERTVWIFEGVVPYLPGEALEETLSTIARRSSDGSTVCITYLTEAMTSLPAALEPVTLRAFNLIGEPLRSTLPPNLMRGILLRHGFEVTSDTGILTWHADFAPHRRPAPLSIGERLVVARKR